MPDPLVIEKVTVLEASGESFLLYGHGHGFADYLAITGWLTHWMLEQEAPAKAFSGNMSAGHDPHAEKAIKGEHK